MYTVNVTNSLFYTECNCMYFCHKHQFKELYLQTYTNTTHTHTQTYTRILHIYPPNTHTHTHTFAHMHEQTEPNRPQRRPQHTQRQYTDLTYNTPCPALLKHTDTYRHTHTTTTHNNNKPTNKQTNCKSVFYQILIDLA